MIRAGIIGTGFIGGMHFNTYHKLRQEVKVVALCDKDEKRRSGDFSEVVGNLEMDQSEKIRKGQLKSYARYQDLIADPDIDLVDVCTPTCLHREMAVAARMARRNDRFVIRSGGQGDRV